MSIRESAVEKAVCEHARQGGCTVMKLAGPNQKGQPDRMFLKHGRVMFIEFKAPGKKPTELQERWLSHLKAAGFQAHVCDSVSEGLSLLGKHIL